MKNKIPLSLPILLCFLLLLFSSKTASAITARVVSSSALCSGVSATNPCYTDVQLAIKDANATSSTIDTIEIHRGTYPVANATLNKGVTILGVETAKTILNGQGASTILTIDSATASMTIRNLTFFSARTGILVRNSPSVNITNNIFEIGTSSTAIQFIASPAKIANNTFFVNGVGIASDLLTLNIINNIFYQNGGTAISPNTMNLTNIKNNLFFGGTIGPPVLPVTTMPISSADPNWVGNISTLDPLFVNTAPSDITQRDFHLISTPTDSSPCRDTGNSSEGADSVDGTRADIGAYGGSNADTIPFPVSGLNSSATTTTPAIVTLSWTANKAYTIKGYNIYYGYSPGARNGTDAIVSGGTTTVGPRIDAGNVTIKSLIVSRTSVTPAAPALNNASPLNGSLKLSWSAVSGATGYNIYYSLATAPTSTFPVIPVSGGNTTTYTLPGLTNGVFYNIVVKAVSQAVYYFSVTAYDTTSSTGTPGIAHESGYSDENSVTVGDIKEGGPSNVVIGMPEPTIPIPNLPNNGCFIATAAYGSPNDRSVMVLREFRDRYLVTNAPGKAFVRWYYAISPAAARFITDHPALRPVARTVLAPAVAIALFLTRTSPAAQTAVLVMLIALAYVLLRRHRTIRSRTLAKETTE